MGTRITTEPRTTMEILITTTAATLLPRLRLHQPTHTRGLHTRAVAMYGLTAFGIFSAADMCGSPVIGRLRLSRGVIGSVLDILAAVSMPGIGAELASGIADGCL